MSSELGKRDATKAAQTWHALTRHLDVIAKKRMDVMFHEDPARADRFTIEAAGLYFDYSKNRINSETLKLLFDLARDCAVEARRDRMFAGDHINLTEDRAVLHTALRDRSLKTLIVDGEDVFAEVNEVRQRAYAFCRRVRDGSWVGYSGAAITDIVNIGIGGSDLGPRMACAALAAFGLPRLTTHFVANIDGDELGDVLAKVNPATTLFIIASKTFTTIETLTNARSARDWFLANGGSEATVAKHFVAVSSNDKGVSAFGIDPANMFGFWDWVGGRFSLWSSIGLSIMLYVGPENFDAFLDGAAMMDRHFREAPLESNMPVIMALVGIWYRNFHKTASVAVLPYSNHLGRLPAYLQQLQMESNGKSVTLEGKPVTEATCPVFWGEPGTMGQHAFYQLLHQGTDLIPIDFILPINPTHKMLDHHRLLVANCLAQGSALMRGKSAEEVSIELRKAGMASDEVDRLVPHRVFQGDRPSNTILMERLEPATLGALIALYEHRVLVEGTIWNINSFDQWGVELGKSVANNVTAGLMTSYPTADRAKAVNSPELVAALDPSTAALLTRVRRTAV